MSVAGLTTFNRNLKRVMATDTFQTAGLGQRLRLGHRLLQSRFGLGSMLGFGPTAPLPEPSRRPGSPGK